jgi:hypothetical protein
MSTMAIADLTQLCGQAQWTVLAHEAHAVPHAPTAMALSSIGIPSSTSSLNEFSVGMRG